MNRIDMFNFSARLYFDKRNVSKEGDVTLYHLIIINREKKRIPLNLKWPLNLIDKENGILKPRFKGDPDVKDYNLIISDELAKYIEIRKKFRLMRQNLTIESFMEEIVIYEEYDNVTNLILNRLELKFKSLEITQRTYLNQRNSIEMFRKFRRNVKFIDLSEKLMRKYVAYLDSAVKDDGEPYSQNSKWGFIKVLKSNLREIQKENQIKFNENVFDISIPPDKHRKPVFLVDEEIRRIMILRKSGGLTDLQYRVATAFLFTCFTSLRISDVYRANSDWSLEEKGFLSFIPFKTRRFGKRIKIPLSPLAESFIMTVSGNFFRLPNQVQYNETLKQIAKLAQINKVLTSHVGRHTYGYLYMKNIGNIYGLMEIMGHTKVETTAIYSHLDDEYLTESAKALQAGFADLMDRKRN